MLDTIPNTLPPTPLTLCELGDPGVAGQDSYSPFCTKIHRALRAKGLAYARRHGMHPGVHAHLNPLAQVPVLLVGEEPVADSTRILERLEPFGAPLVPTEADAAAEAWLYEELADTALNGYLVAARWADPRNWPRVEEAYFAGAPAPVRWIVPRMQRRRVLQALHARDVTRGGLDALWDRFENQLDHLDARAPREGFWVGASPSVADVAIFGQLHTLRTDLTPWQRARVEARARLRAWLDRVEAVTRAH